MTPAHPEHLNGLLFAIHTKLSVREKLNVLPVGDGTQILKCGSHSSPAPVRLIEQYDQRGSTIGR
jgi:hypothetical protein